MNTNRPGGETKSNPSPSTDRAMTVLEALIESEDALTLTALAKRAGVPLATCASIAQTFEQRGYAVRTVVGRSHFWRPTLRLYSLSTKLIRAVDPHEAAQPHLQAVSEQLGMPAHLGVLDGRSIVYVAKAAPPGFIQFDTFRGKVAPFHLTALGRAIAAHLPEQELSTLIGRGLAMGTGPNAHATSTRWLRAELAKTHERGYAVEDEEEQAEIGCIAAPVFDAGDRVRYAVGVTGFAKELIARRFDEGVTAVIQAAQRISIGLGSQTYPLRQLRTQGWSAHDGPESGHIRGLDGEVTRSEARCADQLDAQR